MPINAVVPNLYYPVNSKPESKLQAFCGSFVKDTGGAPATQIIDTVPFRPVAVIFYSAGTTASATLTSSYRFFIGAAVEATNGETVMGSEDAVSRGNCSRVHQISECCGMLHGGEAWVARANFVGFTDSGFNISWGVNDGNGNIINFIALAGCQASIVSWSFPAGTGNNAITGVGFKPDVAINLSTLCTTVGTAEAAIDNGIGWVDSGGGQRALGFANTDNTVTQNGHVKLRNDRCIVGCQPLTGAETYGASFTSFDEDGFTFNINVASTSARVITLCLKGVQTDLNDFTKTSTTPAPQSQAVSSMAFQPKVVLFFVADILTNNISGGTAVFVWSFGATSGPSNSNCSGVGEKASTGTSDDESYDAPKAIAAITSVGPAVKYEADLTSLDANGFTLNWTTINNSTTVSVCYLGLG